jgi:hypothetical protein
MARKRAGSGTSQGKRPTTSSRSVEPFTGSDFPEVSICVEPAFQGEAATRAGYTSPNLWYRGVRGNGDTRFIGWVGDGGNGDANLPEDIITIKKDSRLGTAKVRLTGKSSRQIAELVLPNPVYPVGRCGRVVPPLTGTLDNDFLYTEDTTDNTNQATSIHLRDPLNTADYFPIPVKMRGHDIKLEKGMFVKYRTEISKAVSDPATGCKEYTENYTYGDCVRKDIEKKVMGALGCMSPLLLTKDTEATVCKKPFNVSKEKTEEIGRLFLGIYTLDYNTKTSACKTPCTETVFETKRLYSGINNMNVTSVRIVFGKNVLVIVL